MIDQINFYGLNKVEVAIGRLQMYVPENGYYLCFGGGKDSIVIKELCNLANVKYDAHYSRTTVDPPELIQYIREYHSDVKIENATYKDGTTATMWNLIPKKKIPPTRLARYCCDVLKETGGKGRFVVTGIRWAESPRRRNSRSGLELNLTKTGYVSDDPDNPSNEQMARICPTKGKHILNPIIDWEDDDVWDFIHQYNLPYCTLYDQGFKRIGCIGCPMSSKANEELERYPKIKQAYLKAFERMLSQFDSDKCTWKTADDVMNWWLRK